MSKISASEVQHNYYRSKHLSKHSTSSEFSGESVVAGTVTDFEFARTLGNLLVGPAYSMSVYDNHSEIVWSSNATSVKG